MPRAGRFSRRVNGGRMGPRRSAVEVLAHHALEVKNVVRAKGATWGLGLSSRSPRKRSQREHRLSTSVKPGVLTLAVLAFSARNDTHYVVGYSHVDVPHCRRYCGKGGTEGARLGTTMEQVNMPEDWNWLQLGSWVGGGLTGAILTLVTQSFSRRRSKPILIRIRERQTRVDYSA
jgi:hypothetical protein